MLRRLSLREARRLRQARYRARLRQGIAVYPVPLHGEALQFLIQNREHGRSNIGMIQRS